MFRPDIKSACWFYFSSQSAYCPWRASHYRPTERLLYPTKDLSHHYHRYSRLLADSQSDAYRCGNFHEEVPGDSSPAEGQAGRTSRPIRTRRMRPNKEAVQAAASLQMLAGVGEWHQGEARVLVGLSRRSRRTPGRRSGRHLCSSPHGVKTSTWAGLQSPTNRELHCQLSLQVLKVLVSTKGPFRYNCI